MRSLLNTELTFCRDMDKRTLPPYHNFLSQQKKFIDIQYGISKSAQGHETQGMRQLRYLINFIDRRYLLGDISNYDRYVNYLQYAYDDLVFSFDQSMTGTPLYGYYVGTNTSRTKEYIFPVRDVNSITRLPMMHDDWENWSGILPLRLWSHDSSEFTTQMVNTAIKFHKDYPSYAVLSIDPIALILKYVMWFKYRRKKELADDLALHAPDQFFLHKYVFVPLLYDLGDIWLLKQLNRVLRVEEREELAAFSVKNLQSEPQYGYIAGNCSQGFEYLWSTFCTSNNIRPESILSSKLLFGGSIHQRMRYAERNIPLPAILRWDWARLLRDYDLITLFLRVWGRRKHLPVVSKIITNMTYDIKRMRDEKITTYCNNFEMRLELEQKLLEISELVDELKIKKK